MRYLRSMLPFLPYVKPPRPSSTSQLCPAHYNKSTERAAISLQPLATRIESLLG